MVVAIEGLIGVGKSTVLKALGGKSFEEAVAHWTLLKKFYSQQSEYSYVFQLQVMATYAEVDESYDFSERSAMSALGVFSSMLVKSGMMKQEQMQMLYAIYCSIPHTDPSHYVYLKASPELCLERLQARARDGETVSLEYLQSLESAYETFFKREDIRDKVSVVSVDRDDSPQQIAEKIQEILPPNSR